MAKLTDEERLVARWLEAWDAWAGDPAMVNKNPMAVRLIGDVQSAFSEEDLIEEGRLSEVGADLVMRLRIEDAR